MYVIRIPWAQAKQRGISYVRNDTEMAKVISDEKTKEKFWDAIKSKSLWFQYCALIHVQRHRK